HGGREVLRLLLVPAHTQVDRQVARGERVLQVGVGVLLLDVQAAVAGEADQSARAALDEIAAAGPAGQRRYLGFAVAGAELELVREAAGVEEVRGVGLVLVRSEEHT